MGRVTFRARTLKLWKGDLSEADLSSVVEAGDSDVWVRCGRWTSPRYPDQHVEELARIELETGRVPGWSCTAGTAWCSG